MTLLRRLRWWPRLSWHRTWNRASDAQSALSDARRAVMTPQHKEAARALPASFKF